MSFKMMHAAQRYFTALSLQPCMYLYENSYIKGFLAFNKPSAVVIQKTYSMQLCYWNILSLDNICADVENSVSILN